MEALSVDNGTLAWVHSAPDPVPGPEDVVIRPLLAGICNTDLELLAGYYDYQGIPGHEFVGVVMSGPRDWVGKRVVGEINIACGQCDMCLRGVASQCRSRTVLGIKHHDGAFAEGFTLPVRNLLEVPPGVTDEQAVFTEPLAAALEVLQQVHVRPADRVVVLGAGKLGLLVAQVLRLTGADLAVVIRHDRQRDLLAGWGIPGIPFESLPVAQADLVVDCTGRSDGFADALSLLRPRGTMVLKSTYHGLPQADLTRIAVEEFHVVGSRCGPFEPALRLLQQGLVDVESMIDARYPLADGVAAFADAASRGTLKVLLTF